MTAAFVAIRTTFSCLISSNNMKIRTETRVNGCGAVNSSLVLGLVGELILFEYRVVRLNGRMRFYHTFSISKAEHDLPW